MNIFMNDEKFYMNHCWDCKKGFTSMTAQRCRICGWYICPRCGACSKGCPQFDNDGYDHFGYNNEGYDKEGFDKNGFDENNIHRNGTPYNDMGFDANGYDKDGFDKTGKDADGYNRKGYDHKGFNREKRHQNGTFFDNNGLNIDGFDVYDLECRNYGIGTKVMFKGIKGEIISYDPQKAQPIVKIKLETNEVRPWGLKTLIKNGFIKRIME